MERIDWKRAEYNLAEIASAAGGRVYSGGSTLDLTAKYDDLMENLRLRYVITYRPSTNADLSVELVNPRPVDRCRSWTRMARPLAPA
jgi:hypothetical protein